MVILRRLLEGRKAGRKECTYGGRKAKSKVKVKDTGKVKVKAKVVWNIRTPQPRLLPSFPSWMWGFCGMRGEMLRGATIFSFCLLLILCRRRFRRSRENIAYSLLAATAATSINPSYHQIKSHSVNRNENRSPTTNMRFVSLDGAGNKKAEILSATAAPKEDSRISLGWQTAKKQAMFKSIFKGILLWLLIWKKV
jgi:hypothetical protein